MNLLKNKDLLRRLLNQGDVLNTINGGISKTSVKTSQNKDSFVITVSAPSVSPDAFNIILNYNQLIIFSVLKERNKYLKAKEVMNLPLFSKTFNIPAYIDADKIEAIHENGQLKVILPFSESIDRIQRKINIRHL